MFYQSKRNSWKEVLQIGICSTKMALLTEGSASNRNLQHKNGSLARWKCVKSEFAAQRWITHPKKVLQIGVCSTKMALSPEGSASNRSLLHKDGSLTRRKCFKSEFAAQKWLSYPKEVRQTWSLQHKDGSLTRRKCFKSEFAAQRWITHLKEVLQIGVCSTKMDHSPEESASNWSLQHKNGSPTRRKCVKSEFAAQRWITHPKEVLQIGVCCTKMDHSPEESASNWSLLHKKGSPTR
ncbi:hypothetical protein [Metabacillus hrfriensis]|uniref:Uncharacterized protein n=1 Tax=Metabacillus hrfriensis TaxID=3048891 RepID=A0ACD4REF9_9BACI|nr:hypothetical protein [Metabacillus sp. CT-WN-B3]WHZ58879.1 hypothetical protein QLQ22_05950 [Metabacillus sp. CT-WN-B3]